MRNLLIAVTMTVFAAVSFGQTPANASPQPDKFKEYASKLRAGDAKVDYTALRMSSMASDEKDAGQPDRELRKKMVVAFNAKKYKEAIQLGNDTLKTGLLDSETHMILALAHQHAGNKEKHEFHKNVYLGLVNSILASGDGRSTKTAYVVINVAEEYAVLTALELKRGSQALLNEDGKKFDVLTVQNPQTNESEKVYFNIDNVWKGYENLFKQN